MKKEVFKNYFVKLIDITKENIDSYKQFEENYCENLSQYLSRIYPDEKAVIKWCYINVNNENIGSVWLEIIDKSTAKLGVFIAYEQHRHNGYGTLAVKEMLMFAKSNNFKNVVLNVRDSNNAAYNAYKKLGFEETNRFIKDNGVSVITMEHKF